jgi:hypothetical protein
MVNWIGLLLPAAAMPSGRQQVDGLRKNRSGRTDRRPIDLLGIEHPLVLAPMPGPGTVGRLPLFGPLSGREPDDNPSRKEMAGDPQHRDA